MTTADQSLIARFWRLLFDTELDIRIVIQQCIRDAGYDFDGTGLDFGDLLDIWRGELDNKDWHALSFFSGELLSFYAAMGNNLPKTSIPCWLFAAIIKREAITRNFSSADLVEDDYITLMNSSIYHLGRNAAEEMDKCLRASGSGCK